MNSQKTLQILDPNQLGKIQHRVTRDTKKMVCYLLVKNSIKLGRFLSLLDLLKSKGYFRLGIILRNMLETAI